MSNSDNPESIKNHNFETLWKNHISPALESLGKERSKANYRVLFGLGYFISVGVGLFLYNYTSLSFVFSVLVTTILASVCRYWRWKIEDNYADKFKKEVVKAFNEVLHFEWEISTNTGTVDSPIDQQGKRLVEASKFSANYDYVDVGDKLSASWKGHGIDVFECLVNTRGSRNYTAIFDGLIAKITINEEFESETGMQARAGEVSATTGGEFAGNMKKVDLEWADFEDWISIRGTDQIEARKIFTPDFMEVIYDWRNEHGKPVRITFIGSAIYLGCPTDISFEPKLLRVGGSRKQDIKNFLEPLRFIENFVKMIDKHKYIYF